MIEQKMSFQEPSLITKYFSESINKNECIKLLPFLSSVISDYLEDKNQNLIDQLKELKEKYYQAKEQGDILCSEEL